MSVLLSPSRSRIIVNDPQTRSKPAKELAVAHDVRRSDTWPRTLHMTESSDASDTPAKPQDYAGLRTELATPVNDFAPCAQGVVRFHNSNGCRPFGCLTANVKWLKT